MVKVEVIVLIFAGTSREVEKGPKPNRTVRKKKQTCREKKIG